MTEDQELDEFSAIERKLLGLRRKPCINTSSLGEPMTEEEIRDLVNSPMAQHLEISDAWLRGDGVKEWSDEFLDALQLTEREKLGAVRAQNEISSLTQTFSVHLAGMAQYISDVLSVVPFGANGATARADDGRRDVSQLPSVTWIQNGITFTISLSPVGIGTNRRFEVALASLESPHEPEPRAISWADPKTLKNGEIIVERFDILPNNEGRYIINIRKRILEERLDAMNKIKVAGRVDQIIAFSPLVMF